MVENSSDTIVFGPQGVQRIHRGPTTTLTDADPPGDFGSIGAEYVAPLVAGMTLAALTVAGGSLVASVGAAELAAMATADFFLGLSAA